jgi:hypothetical protein
MQVEASIGVPLVEGTSYVVPSPRIKQRHLPSNLVSIPENKKVNELFLCAVNNEWRQASKVLKKRPEEAYHIHSDGTTALHLAVMSRTGYVFQDGIRQRKAPMNFIEALLVAYPDAAMQVCLTNTYSPLAYACLVVEREPDLLDAEAIVRLLLKYCPKCSKVTTSGSLTALDVHIVSYSQKHQDILGENPLSGRTNTVVLRTLLEHDPSLARVRIVKDTVNGAVELLYRSNANSFLEVVSLDEIKQKKKPSSDSRESQMDKIVITEVTKWWVWRWLILLLKYGTMPRKKIGARFLTVQAAAGLIGCPIPVLTLAMNVFPAQIRQVDEMYGDDGNLPLHEVCAWPCEYDCTSTDPVIPSRKGMAIVALLKEYPEAAKIFNRFWETPLELAVSTGTTWDFGVRKLCRAYPEAVCIRSRRTGLYPFMTAAVARGIISRQQEPLPSSKRSLMSHVKNLAKQDLQSVRTIYGILRANPLVLINCFLKEKERDKSLKFSSSLQDLWASKNDSSIDWGQFSLRKL